MSNREEIQVSDAVTIYYRQLFQKPRTVYGTVLAICGDRVHVKTASGTDVINKDGSVPGFGDSYWVIDNNE